MNMINANVALKRIQKFMQVGVLPLSVTLYQGHILLKVLVMNAYHVQAWTSQSRLQSEDCVEVFHAAHSLIISLLAD